MSSTTVTFTSATTVMMWSSSSVLNAPFIMMTARRDSTTYERNR